MECPILQTVYNNDCRNGSNGVFAQFKGNLNFDTQDSFASENSAKMRFETVKSKQGPIGKFADLIKNRLGLITGSKSVEAAIKLNESGQISDDKTEFLVNDYIKKQTKALEFVADCASTFAGGAIYAFARKKIPNIDLFYAMLLSTTGGAITKAGIKHLDSKLGNREYTTRTYDVLTGGINGLLCPVADGIGNITSKKTAKLLGASAVNKPKTPPVIKGDAFVEILTTPRQTVRGNIFQKLASYISGKSVKCSSKFGLAFVIRESIFEMKMEKSLNKGLGFGVMSFLPERQKQEIEARRKKMEESTKPPSNDVFGVG